MIQNSGRVTFWPYWRGKGDVSSFSSSLLFETSFPQTVIGRKLITSLLYVSCVDLRVQSVVCMKVESEKPFIGLDVLSKTFDSLRRFLGINITQPICSLHFYRMSLSAVIQTVPLGYFDGKSNSYLCYKWDYGCSHH